MRTPASIANHPIHPMLIPIPIGLWLFSFVCDLTFVLGQGVSLWFTLSFWTMIGGLVGAVLAAIPGFIDMVSLRGPPKRIALIHMALNATIIVLYAINIGMRIQGSSISGVPLAMSMIAVLLLAA